ncbi:MAG TPA: hypothetical protein VFW11_01745 [Cyclobacteriaceae bacterium]|nr:hypothetical protein [Cyclobacteriaceae bacterium]
MYRLSSLILTLVGFVPSFAQLPHGDKLKVDCAACHNPAAWTPLKDKLVFDHSTTKFPLEGSHQQVDCKDCHTSLIFEDASTQCVGCHTDVHNMSVGNDCARCHGTQNWIVDNIPELHERSGFPLVGTHSTVTCAECHISETNIRFNPIGNDCINCHRDDYATTDNPNHQQAGYSTNCIECHDPLSTGWSATLVNHDFFPLEKGHDINDCKQCHLTTNYSDASPECVSCHQDDYTATTNPSHASANFSNDCAECHTIGGWSPSSFDHNTVHPLLGTHATIATNCNLCHAQGFANTPNTCVGCHLDDFNKTTNPNHATAQFPTDCAQCHNETAWIPSSFDHNSIYPLQGAHSAIANDCNKCHAQGYANTPNTCVGCHLADYNSTTNPNHSAAQFPTDCTQCHSETAWVPSTFDHDGMYFPIYSGKHKEAWNSCAECHTNSSNYSVFSCIDCHEHSNQAEVNNKHSEVNGYSYASNACLSCHPRGN